MVEGIGFGVVVGVSNSGLTVVAVVVVCKLVVPVVVEAVKPGFSVDVLVEVVEATVGVVNAGF